MSVFDHVSGRLSELDKQVVAHVPPGGNWRDLPDEFPSARVAQIRASAAAGEGSRSTYYGRLRPDRPSYTISTYFNRPGNGCFIHPQFPRLITVREAARLQGFPDSFRFAGRGRSRFTQVGNAVPPLLAYQVARVLTPGSSAELFSGAGGLALGFRWAGFEPVAAVDNDRAAVATFVANHGPDGTILADLSNSADFDRSIQSIRRRLGKDGLDVLLGGPPCQGFSTAGKWLRRDSRNDLVFRFVAAVDRLRPRDVVMENVAALLWRRGRPYLEKVRSELHRLGYRTSVALLHAEAFGLPQLRRRLIMVASRDVLPGWPAPAFAAASPSYPAHQPGFDTSLSSP
ncbi:MAG: DNA (cytosine-5-)-methyltransferase, partial [Candidatus Saccharimonadales bacterium]